MWHPEGPGLLLGKPLLRRRQPCRRHPAEPERGRDQQGERRSALLSVSGQNSQLASSSVSKKISLKMMTLNNSRQKINDCLGNPVEIGIA